MYNERKLPLVSLISPCYNGEDYVTRFLDSVLLQTYKNIEFIFVNDGSQDKTEDIVLSYNQKFVENGITFHYIHQENKGQAAAINKGLAILKGKYIAWADSDDILEKTNIELKVQMMEEHPEYDLVISEATLVTNEFTTQRFRRIPPKNRKKDKLFDDLILERNVVFPPGVYLIRTSSFFEAYPERSIYESRGGQNWQMLLPIAYKGTYGYIKKSLYKIIARPDSHSRALHSQEDKLKRCDVHEDLLLNVIMQMSEMSDYEKNRWRDVIKEKYAFRKLDILFEYKNIDAAKKYYEGIKHSGVWSIKLGFMYIRIKYPILNLLFRCHTLLSYYVWRIKSEND